MHISVIQALHQFATKEMDVSQRLSVPGAQHTYKQLMTMGFAPNFMANYVLAKKQ